VPGIVLFILMYRVAVNNDSTIWQNMQVKTNHGRGNEAGDGKDDYDYCCAKEK